MTIIDNVKEISDLIKKYNDQELYQKIVELREEILALREENIGLKEEVTALNATTDIASRLIRRDNNYYLDDGTDNQSGPFCMSCWDYENKLVNVRVHRTTTNGRTTTSYSCQICNTRGNK